MLKSEFDITKAKGYILHGCNCQGKMGAGLAKAIADKWPDVKRSYQNHLNLFFNKRDALGTIQVVSLEKNSVQVVNCFTQEYYGRDKGVRYASYDAIDKCMEDVVSIASTYHPIMDINIPKIGCSLGGGHWPVVLEIIKFRLASVKNRVVMWMPDENRKYELFGKEIEFSKGDRVICTSDYYGDPLEGWQGTVDCVSKDGSIIWVDWDGRGYTKFVEVDFVKKIDQIQLQF